MLERRSQLRAPHPHFGNVTRLLQLLLLMLRPDTLVAGGPRDDRRQGRQHSFRVMMCWSPRR